MKRIFLLSLAALFMLLSACEQKRPKKVAILFNEKNFFGWQFEFGSDTIPAEKVFSIKKKILHVSGKPFGYMYAEKEYENYSLHVEWRWTGEASNSGIFLHAQPLVALWHGLPFPSTIECQLKAGNAGDLVLLGDARVDELAEGSIIKEKFNPSNEKPVGEWNHADIICDGNTIDIYINGQLQNSAKGANYSKGRIGLQSEGGAIEFRNVTLSPLKKERKKRR